MRRSAAQKASEAAILLLAWLDTQPGAAGPARATDDAGPPEPDAPLLPIPSDAAPDPTVGGAGAAGPGTSRIDGVAVSGRSQDVRSTERSSTSGGAAPSAFTPSSASAARPVAPMWLAHTDWLYHRLTITGPGDVIKKMRRAAAGAGIVPWQLDLDRMQEDVLHLLMAPPQPQRASLSVAGARIVAGQLCDAVARRQALAVARIGLSRACPFDLHRLVPVPEDILRRGPDDPDALAWLWQHWGTTRELRHVVEVVVASQGMQPQPVAGDGKIELTFWSADWSPWPALAQLEKTWPALRFVLRPRYDLA